MNLEISTLCDFYVKREFFANRLALFVLGGDLLPLLLILFPPMFSFILEFNF